MDEAKTADSPTSSATFSENLPDGQQGRLLGREQHNKYRSIIGGLLYLANTTRPDLSYPVGRLSQYLNAPKEHHMNAAKRVLRYVKGTTSYGLIFRSNNGNLDDHILEQHSLINSNKIVGYSDADWATDPDHRRSISGGIITHNGNVVSWFSKKQPIVAQSTMEAEYIAAATTTKNIKWFQKWIQEMFGEITPAILNCDNTSAISFIKTDQNNSRTRHIDIRFHFVKEYVEQGDLLVKHIPTNDQLADILTKNLPTDKFKVFRDKLLSKI